MVHDRITGMPTFVPGLQLAREFYAEAVHPLLAEHFPQVRYAAGLLGPGIGSSGARHRAYHRP
jgi:hypothetical protein